MKFILKSIIAVLMSGIAATSIESGICMSTQIIAIRGQRLNAAAQKRQSDKKRQSDAAAAAAAVKKAEKARENRIRENRIIEPSVSGNQNFHSEAKDQS
jgi:hypothetical protein